MSMSWWRRTVWCALWSALAAAPSAGAALNLLTDGGFEKGTIQLGDCERVTGSLPLSWADNSCWFNATRVDYDQVPSPAHQGRALKVQLRQGLFQIAQPVALQLDWRYEASVWLRSAEPMVVRVALRQAAPPYADYGSRYMRTSDQWVQVKVNAFTHGLTAAQARQALFMVGSATPGTLWVDDAALSGAAVPLALPGAPVPAAYFGTHIHHVLNRHTALEDSHAGSVRVWDAERSQWAFIQPRPPGRKKAEYDWAALDSRVDAMGANHAEGLMVLGGYAPAWASAADGEAIPEVAPDQCVRCDRHPRRMADWRQWVSTLTQRYAQTPLTAWEVWNEPAFVDDNPWCLSHDACESRLGSGYSGSPEDLLALQREALPIVRKANPAAKLVTAGISYHHREYLDRFLAIGGGESADVIGYHIYLEGLPEGLLTHVLALKGLMQDHKVGDKPLWCTECGIMEISLDGDPASQVAKAARLPIPAMPALGAAYLSRMMIVSWAAGLGRFYQYAWDSQHPWPAKTARMARGTNRVTDVAEAGQAFRQTSVWMVGKRMVGLDYGTQPGDLWRVSLQDGRGRKSYIVWQPASPEGRELMVPAPDGVKRACKLDGACRDLTAGGKVPVDFRPMLLE
jgi:hypothetical protein